MASHVDTVQHLIDLSGLGTALSWRRMFGEFALYLDGRVVALVCDDQVYLKPTDAGRRLLGTPTEAPPYPGAKPHFLLQAELDDPPLLRQALQVTAAALPLPKPKAPREAARKVAKTGAQAATKTTARKAAATPKPRKPG